MGRRAWLILCLTVVVGAAGIGYGVWRRPRPLLMNPGDCRIIRVAAKNSANTADPLPDTDDYNEQEILERLKRCTVRRTLEWDGRYQLDDLDLMIVVLSPGGGGFTFLFLGGKRVNYAQDSDGKYVVEDAAELKADLLAILARGRAV